MTDWRAGLENAGLHTDENQHT